MARHLHKNPTTKTMILIGSGVVGAAALIYFLWPSEEEAASSESGSKTTPALAFGPGKDRKDTRGLTEASKQAIATFKADTLDGQYDSPLLALKSGEVIRVARSAIEPEIAADRAHWLNALSTVAAEGPKTKREGGIGFRPKSKTEKAIETAAEVGAATAKALTDAGLI